MNEEREDGMDTQDSGEPEDDMDTQDNEEPEDSVRVMPANLLASLEV